MARPGGGDARAGAGPCPGLAPNFVLHARAQPASPRALASRLSGAVVAVVGLFAFIYSVIMFVVIVPWLSFSVHGIFHGGLFTALTALALCCYALCVLGDPGAVPAHFTPDAERPAALQEVKRRTGAPRFCNKCLAHKPARAHHCRVCQRCILRMDHHCFWLNNCVGHKTHKPFFLFLLYATGACAHAVAILALKAIYLVVEVPAWRGAVAGVGPGAGPLGAGAGRGPSAPPTSPWAPVLQVACAFLAMPLTIALGFLLGWHIYLLCTNRTTIEYHEGVRAKWTGTTGAVAPELIGQLRHRHPYHLGTCANLHAILGPHAATWGWPCDPPDGDGTRFDLFLDQPLDEDEPGGTEAALGPPMAPADAAAAAAIALKAAAAPGGAAAGGADGSAMKRSASSGAVLALGLGLPLQGGAADS